ncbi:MAG: RtcB family protein [Thermodesulfobacteriota bacterium]
MELRQIDDYRWEIPQTGAMRVPGIIYADAAMMAALQKEEACQQVANVATLPGIVKASLAMPDIHWGYGFPIGGVAAFDMDEGVISPGGVGYDINCGVRLAVTKLTADEVGPRISELADALYAGVPCGVGSTGGIRLTAAEEKKAITEGAPWAIKRGLGDAEDIDRTEDGGCMDEADPSAVSDNALERGRRQLGTLGSGNHFLEVGVVTEVFDTRVAARFGLAEGLITLMLHSGSRGLGHQVCDDYLAVMAKEARQSNIQLVDRQLACAPVNSSAGRRYFSALSCAANFAWINRQVLLHLSREIFMRVFGKGPSDLGMRLVYDVCHNIAKKERHTVDGRARDLCVHRKGATRALAPGHPGLCAAYGGVGQPVLVPGDMASGSYVLAGCDGAMADTFGSACHGAGRVLSRNAAKKAARGRELFSEMAGRGVVLRCEGRTTAAEEMPEAYKNVNHVVDVVHRAGIAKKVSKIKPLAVIKG